ncbi:hypothetical protein [Demequina sp. NBRC 110054]|uniref:hypothetical protein n=1 Tax=Demequina sp. NBRC 110054 TaxID=1570343 RepID=UPI000A06BAD8|nr:hypothetical protein [Demequina sp. NBRC 110054]
MASSRATVLHHGGSMRPVAMLAGVVLFLLVSLLPAYGLFRVFAYGDALQTSEMVLVGACLAGLVAAVWIGATVSRRFDGPAPGPVELDRLPEVLVLSLTPSSSSRARLVSATWRLEVPAGGLLELDADSRAQGDYPVRHHRWHCNGEVMEFSMPLDSTTMSLEPLVEACAKLDIRLTIAGDWIAGLATDADDQLAAESAAESSAATISPARGDKDDAPVAEIREAQPTPGAGFPEPLWPQDR